MEVVVKTDTTNYTTFFNEQGEQVFPCRCGETHEGFYACEDYLRHECLHKTDLIDMEHGLVICMDCGNTWRVKGGVL